jgi:hypothetical protein
MTFITAADRLFTSETPALDMHVRVPSWRSMIVVAAIAPSVSPSTYRR